MTVIVLLGVMLLGGVGAVARFLVDGGVSRRRPGRVPTGTLAVNLSGALGLGLLDGLALPKDLALLLGTGAIGAYTTFSTWMLETQRLVEERQLGPAVVNVVGSVAVGVVAAAAGLWLGGRL